jgi:hypothetical protein
MSFLYFQALLFFCEAEILAVHLTRFSSLESGGDNEIDLKKEDPQKVRPFGRVSVQIFVIRPCTNFYCLICSRLLKYKIDNCKNN